MNSNKLFVEDAPGDFYVIHNDCTCCEAPLPEATGLMEIGTVAPGHTSCFIKRQPSTDQEVESMIDAMTVNCMEAIRYRGTCPKILEKMVSTKLSSQCDVISPPTILQERPRSLKNNFPVHTTTSGAWTWNKSTMVAILITILAYFLTAPWFERQLAMLLWYMITVCGAIGCYLKCTLGRST